MDLKFSWSSHRSSFGHDATLYIALRGVIRVV